MVSKNNPFSLNLSNLFLAENVLSANSMECKKILLLVLIFISGRIGNAMVSSKTLKSHFPFIKFSLFCFWLIRKLLRKIKKKGNIFFIAYIIFKLHPSKSISQPSELHSFSSFQVNYQYYY